MPGTGRWPRGAGRWLNTGSSRRATCAPPHRTEANTFSAFRPALRSGPAQECRGVRASFASAFTVTSCGTQTPSGSGDCQGQASRQRSREAWKSHWL